MYTLTSDLETDDSIVKKYVLKQASFMRFIACFLLVIICGCSSNHKTKVERQSDKKVERQDAETVINIGLNNKKAKAADFFDYHHAIVLATTDECLIGTIGRVEFYKDNIYILDSKQYCIFVFDLNGSFKYKIDRKGGSPEEYSIIRDFYIDKEKDHIYIYDGLLGNMLVVDLQGNFLQRITVQKGYSFIKLNNGNWLFYSGNGGASVDNNVFNNVCWYDKDFTLLKQEFPINKEMMGRIFSVGGPKSIFSVHDDQLFFLPLLSNEIYAYHADKDSLVPKYGIRYAIPKHNATIDENTEAPDVEKYLRGIGGDEIPSRINSFYDSRHAVIFSFIFGEGPLMCFYDKLSGESTICEFGPHEIGLSFGPPSTYFTDQDDTLVLHIMSGASLEYYKDDDSNKIVDDIIRKVGDVEDPNPILIFYSFKKKSIS